MSPVEQLDGVNDRKLKCRLELANAADVVASGNIGWLVALFAATAPGVE